MEYDDMMLEEQEDLTNSDARGRALRRQNKRKKKARRRKIVDLRCWSPAKDKPVFSVRIWHYHSKTNNKGKHRRRHGNYDRAKNWDAKDQRRIDQMQDSIKEHNSEECVT